MWIELLVECLLQTHGKGATALTSHGWEQAFGWRRTHCMTAGVKAYPLSPTFPKSPRSTPRTAFPQRGVSYTGFHHVLCISSRLGEDPLLRGCPSPSAKEDVRKWLRAAPAAWCRRQKYGSGNPWEHLVPDPDVWWDIICHRAFEYTDFLSTHCKKPSETTLEVCRPENSKT